jgi:hypothetical protein
VKLNPQVLPDTVAIAGLSLRCPIDQLQLAVAVAASVAVDVANLFRAVSVAVTATNISRALEPPCAVDIDLTGWLDLVGFRSHSK